MQFARTIKMSFIGIMIRVKSSAGIKNICKRQIVFLFHMNGSFVNDKNT